MGLLDFLQTPDAQIGLGLLGGGVMSTPGQALMGSLANIQAQKQNAIKNQLLDMQLQESKLGLGQRQQQMDMMSGLMDILAKSQNGQSSNPAPSQIAQPLGQPAGQVNPEDEGYQFGRPQQPQTPTATTGTAPQASPGGAGVIPGLGINAGQLRGGLLGGIGELGKVLVAANTPTDSIRTANYYGIPESVTRDAMLREAAAKGQMNVRPGGTVTQTGIDGIPRALFTAPANDGTITTWGPNGPTNAKIPGALKAIAETAAAKEGGINTQIPTVVYNPDGTSGFSTKAQDVQRASGAPAAAPAPAGSPDNLASEKAMVSAVAGDIGADPRAIQREMNAVSYDLANKNLDPSSRKILQAHLSDLTGQLVNINAPGNKADAATQPSLSTGAPAAKSVQQGQVTPVLKPGVAQGATLSQDELSKKGSDLMAGNAAANTVISRLQNIKMLAPKAISGAQTDQRDFFNGLLSLAGLPSANDAKTASDLVDKNSAQIVSAMRMQQGGAGTDALQTLLSAANPNRHMTKEAIADAADQLIAQQQMIQSKAKILQPLFQSRDPVSYGNAELKFDQMADPRLWQLQSMPPAQQATYVKSLPPEVAADLLQKRQQLKLTGAL